jgi:hypothetical protein
MAALRSPQQSAITVRTSISRDSIFVKNGTLVQVVTICKCTDLMVRQNHGCGKRTTLLKCCQQDRSSRWYMGRSMDNSAIFNGQLNLSSYLHRYWTFFLHAFHAFLSLLTTLFCALARHLTTTDLNALFMPISLCFHSCRYNNYITLKHCSMSITCSY